MIASWWPSCASRSAYRRARTKSRLPTANRQTMSISTPACHRVSRARTLTDAMGRTEQESDAANSVEKLAGERVVELAAQPRYGHVDHVVEWCGPGGHMPDVAGQHLARYRLAPMAEQILEDVIFLGRYVELAPSPQCLVRYEIDLQVLAVQGNGRLATPTAAQQGADARQDFCEGKRLDQVVVGSFVEPVHPVFDGVFRSEDQHGRLDSTLPQRSQNVDPVAAWQHEVEQHEVERLLVGEIEPFLSRRRDANLEVLGFQALAQRCRDFAFILYDQNPHTVPKGRSAGQV